ncbi:hypothetical protein DB346_05795 [Verrucomicrobia bacterium LW23]|nr:hypothetical protein DB346_05795 [Verrucomicrobia bacterium LW23]
MNPQVRDGLKKTVERYGADFVLDAARCEGILKDVCGESRREIYVLVSCVREGVVKELLAIDDPAAAPLLISRLSQKLQQHLALAAETANWGVETWAVVLGKIPEPPTPQYAPATGAGITGISGLPTFGSAGGGLARNSAALRLPSGPLRVNSGRLEPPKAPQMAPGVPAAITPGVAAPYKASSVLAPGLPSGQLPGVAQRPRTSTPSVSSQLAPKDETVQVNEAAIMDQPVSVPSRPVTPSPNWAEPTEEIIVAQDGRGHFKSLKEALKDAQPGACIYLLPGLYKEGVVISKDVQIRGVEGTREEIQVEFVTAPCFQLTGGFLLINGITVRGRAASEYKNFPAIEVTRGQLTLEDCDMTCDSKAVVSAKGPAAEVLVRQCLIHDGRSEGISFEEGATGIVEHCEITDCRSGIFIGSGCAPHIHTCTILNAASFGFYVNEGGFGVVEDCEISHSQISGVKIRSKANPTFRRCRITSGHHTGVLIGEQGQGIFEDCEICDNGDAAVEISQASKPSFARCQIFEGRAEGVHVYDRGAGHFMECEIYGNVGAGIKVAESANPHFTYCSIHDGQTHGIRVENKGQGVFQNCEIYANAGSGASLGKAANPLLENCSFASGTQNGITCSDMAQGMFRACHISGHSLTAILINGRSTPKFESTQISQNMANGVDIDESSQPLFSSCAISDNSGVGITSTQMSSPRVSDCEISRNYEGGVHVHHQGQGRWEKCVIKGNTGFGFRVSDGGRPSLRQSDIDETQGAGLQLQRMGQGTFEACNIVRSTGPGIEIEAGGNPIVRNLQVLDGEDFGVLVHNGGGGNLQSCMVANNAKGNWSIGPSARVARVGCG